MSDLPQTIDNMIAWYRSDEYAERERERTRRETSGYVLLDRAWKQGIITEAECLYLSSSIAINGGLIISPSMANRLAQVNL